MKKILMLILTVSLCLVVIGCKDKETENVENNNEIIQNELNDDLEADDIEDEENVEEDDSVLSYESNEESFVVNYNDQYDMVFEFEGDKVVSYYKEYEFETEDVAILFEEGYIKDESVISVERTGNVVKVNLVLSGYADLSREQIEQMFSYAKENV